MHIAAFKALKNPKVSRKFVNHVGEVMDTWLNTSMLTKCTRCNKELRTVMTGPCPAGFYRYEGAFVYNGGLACEGHFTCTKHGCANRAIAGHLCSYHHRILPRKCAIRGCDTFSVKADLRAGRCAAHAHRCVHPECTATIEASKKNRCSQHIVRGRGVCPEKGCKTRIYSHGKCAKHGVTRKQVACAFKGCSIPRLPAKTFCLQHQGTKLKKYSRSLCTEPGCVTTSVQWGVCRRHGNKGKGPAGKKDRPGA